MIRFAREDPEIDGLTDNLRAASREFESTSAYCEEIAERLGRFGRTDNVSILLRHPGTGHWWPAVLKGVASQHARTEELRSLFDLLLKLQREIYREEVQDDLRFANER